MGGDAKNMLVKHLANHTRFTILESMSIYSLRFICTNQENKIWLIYAYHRATSEIVSYVWGKHDYETANYGTNYNQRAIRYDMICTDKGNSFIAVFQLDNHIAGKAKNTQKVLKEITVGCDIESDGRTEKLAVFQRNFLIISKRLI